MMKRMYRLRLRFCRGEEVKFISHLDIMRLWQRAFLRAGIPIAYSEGFSPHPRISLAAPLPLGITSEAVILLQVSFFNILFPGSFLLTLANGDDFSHTITPCLFRGCLATYPPAPFPSRRGV